MSDTRSPILILTASAGSGHLVAAQAMEAELRRQAPEERIVVHDVLQSTNAFFRALYAQGYLGLVNHAPAAMGMLYDATDRPNRYFRRNLRSAFQDWNARPAMRLICDLRPRLIIAQAFDPLGKRHAAFISRKDFYVEHAYTSFTV